MANVTTRSGDTFEKIARRVYGDDRKASLIKSANPGAVEPFEAGVQLTAPAEPTRPRTTSADNSNELAVLVNDSRFRYWTGVVIQRSIDSMDQLVISAPFEPDRSDFRAAFRPFSFAPVSVTVGGKALFTGTMVEPVPALEEDARTISAACYSVPAVLGDCTMPASSYPLEWDKVGLQQIAEQIAAPFGLTVEIDGDPGAVFERVELNTAERPLNFLIKLAQQRGLLVSSTEDGALVFAESTSAGRPVAKLREGVAPVMKVAPSFRSQEYYSEITGIEPVFVGLDGSQTTVKNARLRGVVRPFTFELPDTLNADATAACNAKAARMFANAVQYSLTVATWRDPSGALWRPNTTITLNAPGAMIYSDYEFLIRSVTLTRTSDGGDTAVLVLTLPGAFRSQLPESLPWDG